MFPATVIVAPNSLIARTNPSSTPARMPFIASGTVIVKNTLHGPAPRLRADISSRSSTPAIATIVARAISGNETTADAATAAYHVNTMSAPRSACVRPPIGPSRPSRSRRKNPMAIGGTARGSETSTSTINRPGARVLTSSQLTASARGMLTTVATTATRNVSSSSDQLNTTYLIGSKP